MKSLVESINEALSHNFEDYIRDIKRKFIKGNILPNTLCLDACDNELKKSFDEVVKQNHLEKLQYAGDDNIRFFDLGKFEREDIDSIADQTARIMYKWKKSKGYRDSYGEVEDLKVWPVSIVKVEDGNDRVYPGVSIWNNQYL